MSFAGDVDATEGLAGAHRSGLGALSGSAASHVSVRPETRLSGSVDLDSALRPLFPTAARWDYVIGRKQGRKRDLLHWIEIHPASGGKNVGEVAAKVQWLRGWLAGTPLAAYPRRLVWVASGRAAFNARDPKLKALALAGVQFAGGHLTI